MIRAVLDTNVLVSALIASEGTPAELLRRWQQGAFELVVSEDLLIELRDVLDRPKLRRHVNPDESDVYTEMLRARAIVARPSGVAGASPDPADDHVIALAQIGASVLVTGDDQMLRFRVPGLAILSPRSFLEALQG